jgi:hypothetical protein
MITADQRWRDMNVAQRSHPPGRAPVTEWWAAVRALRRRCGTRIELMCRPARPRTAGTSVTAATIITATAIADMNPSRATYGTPESTRPVIAMTTVPPANSTACPAVPFARPMDSFTSMPAARFWRWRVTMNSE